MEFRIPEIVVAGHVCLDIIPTLSASHSEAESLLQPGRLVRIGPASVSLGGCMANTGLALHRLGAATRLVGKIGDDLLGKLLLESVSQSSPHLREGMVIAPGETTSYTIVISPPGVDRSFLHCAGTNDTFSAAELELTNVTEARILHFGYPPLMNQVISDGGTALAKVFQEVQAKGGLASLDMAMPDTTSAGQTIGWRGWLERVLPHVDLFLPSLDEILYMLDPQQFAKLDKEAAGRNLAAVADVGLLERIAAELIELGVPIVVIKMGDQGLFMRCSRQTSHKLNKRVAWKDFHWHAWDDFQAVCPCFDVDVVGTTGAGDCTVAGFLMAVLRGYGPKKALRAATAVGAQCVQSLDATSNIPNWERIEKLANSFRPLRQIRKELAGWTACAVTGVYLAPPTR